MSPSLRETVATILAELEAIGVGDDDAPINGCDAVDLLVSIWQDLKTAYELGGP